VRVFQLAPPEALVARGAVVLPVVRFVLSEHARKVLAEVE
jgi:hypothetical protein